MPMPAFQSTRPRGARPSGATPAAGEITGFNPRAHAGRDSAYTSIATTRAMFQSTRPRGARRIPRTTSTQSPLFQSTRPRGARRLAVDQFVPHIGVSIHAPTRGATRENVDAEQPAQVSIHAPTRGATPTRLPCMGKSLFQSTRPRGARRIAGLILNPRINVSIHAPTRGATRDRPARGPLHPCFNPRAHAGRDASV